MCGSVSGLPAGCRGTFGRPDSPGCLVASGRSHVPGWLGDAESLGVADVGAVVGATVGVGVTVGTGVTVGATGPEQLAESRIPPAPPNCAPFCEEVSTSLTNGPGIGLVNSTTCGVVTSAKSPEATGSPHVLASREANT